MRNFVLTSSSVTDGHPDKLCDRVSDAIVDAFLTLDPCSQLQAECAVASGIVFLVLHSRTSARVDLPAIARNIVSETGYVDADFNAENLTVLTSESHLEAGAPFAHTAGARRIPVDPVSATLFGYACKHSREMLPLSCVLAHRLAARLRDVRQSGDLPNLHPDGHVQVAVRYVERQPRYIEGITIFSAIARDPKAQRDISDQLRELVVDPVMASAEIPLAKDSPVAINPVNTVSTGGPMRHAGLTGRKNDIDTYGGYSRHSGAALSGKDPSRIDRSGAYAARYAAKVIVASGLASECEVQISYAMGRPEPISLEIDTFGSATLPEPQILKALRRTIDFDVSAIINQFNLNELPGSRGGRFFADLSAFGHFGRNDLDLPWEETNKAELLSRNV